MSLYHPQVTVAVFAATLLAVVVSRLLFTSSNLGAWAIGCAIAAFFCAGAVYWIAFIRAGGFDEAAWTAELFDEVGKKVNGYNLFYWLAYSVPGLIAGAIAGGVLTATLSIIRAALLAVNSRHSEAREPRFFGEVATLIGIAAQFAIFVTMVFWLTRAFES